MLGRLASVGGYTALSRVTGFVRDILMARFMGANAMSDAFFVAFRLPNNFRAIFAEGAFNAAFLPRFTHAMAKEGQKSAAQFANEVFAWQMSVQIGLLVVALAGMRWIVAALAPGFSDDPAQMELAVHLTRITFPYLICVAVVAQLGGMLNAIHKFKVAAAAPIMLNIAMVATLSLAPWFPNTAYAAAYGVLIAGFLELGFVLWGAARSGLHLHLHWPRWTPRVREFTRALGAATIGAGSVQIGLFIDTLIASFLPSGDLTALYYADRINQLPMGIVGIALGTVLLPEMSHRIAHGDERAASISQNRAVGLGLLLTLPCVAAFFIMPDLIMRALFAHGAFHVEAAHASAMALVAYGVGLPAFVLVRCITPTFYARHDTATPVRATLIAVAINIGLKFLFVWGLNYGVVGIALGTSLAAWANLATLSLMARRRKLLVLTTELKRALVSIVVAVVAAAAGFFVGSRYGAGIGPPQFHDEITFAIAALAGIAGYAIVVVALRRNLPLKFGDAMIRLFVALELPAALRARLSLMSGGVPGAKWQREDQMHLTLRFIGEVDEGVARDVDDALTTVRAPAFTLEVSGAVEFGGKDPHALWAGVRPNDALIHLQKKIESALVRLGLEAEARKYTPHVTLARLRNAPREKVAEFIAYHSLFSSGPITIDHFALYSSLLGGDGAVYRVESTYPLRA